MLNRFCYGEKILENGYVMDDLEGALTRQVMALRALLSNLVEEEQTYREENRIKIDELLEIRLTLLEIYENAEAKGVPLMERYLLDRGKPLLLKSGLKLEQLNAFKNSLSIEDLSISIQIDQLISLLDKIQETNDHLRMLDEQGHTKPFYMPLIEESPKKAKTQIGVIE